MIVLASAKTMVASEAGKSLPVFLNKSQIIRCELKKLDTDQLSSYFKIKNKTLETTKKYYQQSIVGNVLDSLNGVAFREIYARDSAYITENVFILDALYGILNGNDTIDLYRLDFNCRSLLDQSYYQYWKDDVTSFINKYNCDQLLILSSDEYTKVIDLPRLNKQIFTICFTKTVTNSTLKKQLRGKICNYCIEHKIKDYTALNGCEIDSFTLTLSSNIITVSKKLQTNI